MLFLGGMVSIFLGGLLFIYPEITYVIEFSLVVLSLSSMTFVFFWDTMSFLFCFIVLMITFCVFVYSFYYMDTDKNRGGFSLLLFSFVLSMLILLLSPNLITLLLGWDGLGMTSYLLVIYYSSSSSSVAGMLTFLTNRLGDVFFLSAIGLMFLLGDWEKLNIKLTIFAIILIMGLMTKSAQVPFSAWLPAAMAAPTPVSSLVHSSTLVTAGLYLMIRFYSMFTPFSILVLWCGLFTLLAAGLMALFEWDLKKLIAFSTLSQLGFMVISFSMGLIWVSFFHLITHALFKASLFLSAGVLIHNADNSQEFRNMFIIPIQLHWVSSVINVCLLCLCGIPFTSGFYSKDLIVDGSSFSWLAFCLYVGGVGLTVVYSARFFFFSHRFFVMKSSFLVSYEKVIFLFGPLAILVSVAIWGGWFFFEGFFSFKIFVFTSPGWKLMYFGLLTLLAFLSWSVNKNTGNKFLSKDFLSSIWFLKFMFSSKFLKGGLFSLMNFLNKNDQGILEYQGPQGAYKILSQAGFYLFSFQSFIFFIYFLSFLSAVGLM